MRVSAEAKKDHAAAKSYFINHIQPLRKKIIHLRDNKGRISSTLIAVWDNNNQVQVGWSKYNKHDPFNRSLGIVTAFNRTISLPLAESIINQDKNWSKDNLPVPKVVRVGLTEFVSRLKVNDK